jgi:cobalt-zinc-cadmium efflux system outer membrane protein
VSLSLGRTPASAVLAILLAGSLPSGAQESFDVERYVAIVLRAHPVVGQTGGLEAAADAERKSARLLPDPTFEYSHDRARPTDGSGTRTETGYSISQTIPWPGTFSAGIRAGDRQSDALRAGAESLRWELASEARKAFARLVAARSRHEVARSSEEDARSLRDLVTRRADLGESRESDRIKATVEWLRQQRSLAAAEREAESAETVLRTLAVEVLPRPLAVEAVPHPPMPVLDRDAVVADMLARSPRLRAARAEAERQRALLDVARRSRIPDLDVKLFRSEELDKQASGFSLGLKVPLWNAKRGEIARAQASTLVSGAEADRARLELATEIEARLKELQVAADQAVLLEGEILPSAARSVGLARFSFEEGETSLLDLLDAQRTYRDTLRETAEAHLALSVALAEVQRLVGPDFNPWR